jgi:spore coat protein F
MQPGVSHLAWHETLELHELIGFQANVLRMLKKNIRKVKEGKLRELYHYSIELLEKNLQELLAFLPAAPMVSVSDYNPEETGFYAGSLLGLAKTAVRNYAVAITETVTPILHEVFARHLKKTVKWHYKVYRYMYERGYYPAYDLRQLLQNDYQNAMRAIQMAYE